MNQRGVSKTESATLIHLSSILLVLFAAAVTWSSATAAPPQFTIIYFDVNVGDATLLITPAKHAVLIDAGDPGRGSYPIVQRSPLGPMSTKHPESLGFPVICSLERNDCLIASVIRCAAPIPVVW